MHLLNRILLVATGMMIGHSVFADGVIPDRIDGGPNEPAVIWRAADTVRAVEALPPDILAMLEDYDRGRSRSATRGAAPQSDDPCGGVSYAPVQSEHYLPNDTLADLVESSREVYAGTILAKREGFFRGALVTMLAVRANRLEQDHGTDEVIFVPYPRATIRVNGMTYCARIHGSDVEPAVNDRVIVFSFERGAGQAGAIITADAERELVIAGARRNHLPHALQLQAELEGHVGFDRIRDTVTAAIRRSSERPSSHVK